MTAPGSVYRRPRLAQNRYQDSASLAVAPQTGTPPAGWQSCLGRLPSRLRTGKMAFRRLWHVIEVPQALSTATQTHGWLSARASTRLVRGVGWIPPRQDGAMLPTPTTRAPSVLGLCGWVSAPRTALPRVYRPLVCSLGVSALPRRVVRRTTIPWSSPRALTHALRARREGAGRPHRPYPPPTSPRSPRRATPLSHKQCLHPCTPPHGDASPRRHHPTP